MCFHRNRLLVRDHLPKAKTVNVYVLLPLLFPNKLAKQLGEAEMLT